MKKWRTQVEILQGAPYIEEFRKIPNLYKFYVFIRKDAYFEEIL